jgi:hypothetical protein
MYCGQKLRDTPLPPPPVAETIAFSGAESGVADADDEVSIAPEPAPKTIGGYRLLRLLGSGGMGTVYEAEAPGSHQRVAVKLLSSKLASNPTSVERFRQEGRLASQVAHPRCVFVLSADTDAGRPYIVMELMPGETLKDAVDKRGPLPPEQAIAYMLDVIDGLAEAHRVGMIHRDMKPSNCFLTADGRVKVGDFGLSKSLVGSRDHHLTQSGAFLGTVLFASPEQIRGEPLDYSSDVYSVCATLYYLLCGQAPFHHESVTAVLAKAISEDPEPVSKRRPDVARGLDAVVMKGLERDREDRWQSLDDLRDALVALLPSRQHPARPRALISAYVLDRIVLTFLIVPLELVRHWVTDAGDERIDAFEIGWLPGLLLCLYFAIGEGVFGATPGKWLLGLRVSRLGQTGPPGVWRALVRALVFHGLLVLGMFRLPEECVRWFGPAAGGVIGGFIFLTSAAALLAQVRKRWGYRGVHDLASECHVTQKPLPARKLRLPVKHATPLSTLLPAPTEPLPEMLAGYAVRGRIAVDPAGEQVWVGEDRALARMVLIWLKPVLTPAKPETESEGVPLPEAPRPTRLRRLGGGSLKWSSTEFTWTAFAAPLGGPLLDAIDPRNPLPWADTRHLLDQLAEEFRAAETDGTTLPRVGLDQVWVEPTGRVQVVECSLCAGKVQPAATPLVLLREVASLALEGRTRSHAGPVVAPIPAHAVPVLNRLFTDGGYHTLAEFQKELGETHAHRPEVTPAVRAAQLGIQGAVLALPLAAMFLLAAGLAPYLTLMGNTRADQAQAALDALREKPAWLMSDGNLKDELAHPKLVERLERYRDAKRADAEYRRPLLLAPQRVFLEQSEKHLPDDPARVAGYPVQVREAIEWAGALDGTPRAKSAGPWKSDAVNLFLIFLAIPVGMVILAAILRGGISMLLAGISLVRADGGRVTRRQCAFRAAAVWFPVFALLFSAAWLQTMYPERAYLAAGLWLLAVALLPVYVVIALRFPTRPPQDRVTGTYLVPA